MDDFHPIKVFTSTNEYFIGGVDRYRGIGGLNIYDYNNGEIISIFESDYPFYNFREDECEVYKGKNLLLNFEDKNNDGLCDIELRGVKYNYCKGLSDIKEEYVVDSTIVLYSYLLKQNSKGFIYEAEQ